MAVVEEYPYVDGNGTNHPDRIRHYSDESKSIVQIETGKVYEEAIDIYPCPFTYAEAEESDKNDESESVAEDVVKE